MSTVQTLSEALTFNRTRTLDLLDRIEKQLEPAAVLGWRPGAGRAHLAWQLMHIGITEEIFATERLNPEKPRAFEDLWPRFRGGSTPYDAIPSADEIRRVLGESREHLLDTLQRFCDEQLEEIVLPQRGLTLRQVLHLIAWHEAHHQGQGHITLNLYLYRG